MTDAELKALAERAREAAADNGHCGEGTMERRDRHAFQDATLSDFRRHATPDRVLAILAGKAALADKLQGLEADLRTLLALLDEQREVLRPFAEAGEMLTGQAALSDDAIAPHFDFITVADFRRAAALTGEE